MSRDKTDPTLDAGDDIELARSESSMLGPKDLEGSPDEMFLLRLHSGTLSEKFAGLLKKSSYKPNLGHATKGKVPPLIVGPFTKKDLSKFVDEGLIEADDTLLKSFDRWRGITNFFPELKAAFGELDDVTATSTLSAGGMGFEDSSEKNLTGELPPPKVLGDGTTAGGDAASDPETNESLRLEIETHESDPEPKVDEPAPKKATPTPEMFATASRTSFPKRAGGAPQAAAPIVPEVRAAEPPPPTGVAPLRADLKTPGSRKPFIIGGATLLGLLVIGLFIARFTPKPAPEPQPTPAPVASLATGPTAAPVAPNSWPDELKPRDPNSLFVNDEPLVAKIRPILLAYERGSTALSTEDETKLKSYAQPGSASLEARRLAANQLAAYYLLNERRDDAKAVLEPLLSAYASDAVTYLNLAMINLVDGNLDLAKEQGDAGLRLSPVGLYWVANTIVGIIEGSSNRIDNATRSFRSALESSTNNPYIYGNWIQSLVRAGSKNDVEISSLLREALWADPDRLIDSPIRAPLASHVIMVDALQGLRNGAERASSKLTAGQTAFLRWLENRSRKNQIGQPLSTVMETLKSESTSAQSRLLYAYTLKESNRFDEASQTMGQLLPQLDNEPKFASSWPWTFAADLLMKRGETDQAIILYQKALSRNNLDISAVHGMAMAFRAKGNVPDARARLQEVGSRDPFFVPSILRMERFDWQRRGMSQ